MVDRLFPAQDIERLARRFEQAEAELGRDHEALERFAPECGTAKLGRLCIQNPPTIDHAAARFAGAWRSPADKKQEAGK